MLFLFRVGWILIDRCGKHFGIILNFLRDGSAPLPESPREIAELLAEAKYYCVAELGNLNKKPLWLVSYSHNLFFSFSLSM